MFPCTNEGYELVVSFPRATLRLYASCTTKRKSSYQYPMSDTRLVPDFYHIVQHTLILLNIIICLVR